MAKERRLGRGLEALLGRVSQEPGEENSISEGAPPRDVNSAPLSDPTGPGDPPDTPHSEGADSPQILRFDQAHGLDEVGRMYTANTNENQTSPVSPAGESVPGAPLADEPVEQSEATSPDDVLAANSTTVDVSLIDSNPYQPRQDFDEAELESLAQSLRSHGLLQPVAVRKVDDRYQIVAGERRYRAATKIGWPEVPVQIVEADDRHMAEMALVENIQRKDLNALEKGAAFQRYLEQYGSTQEDLARRLNMDRSTVANIIRLLELPEPVKDAVRQAKITQGHARALLPLGDEREQIEFCQRIQSDRLSVRNTEAMVQEAIQAADAEPLNVVGRDGSTSRTGRKANEHIAALEQEFRLALGAKVKITHSARGRGKLVIHFSSHEEFDRLKSQVCGPGEQAPHGQVG